MPTLTRVTLVSLIAYTALASAFGSITFAGFGAGSFSVQIFDVLLFLAMVLLVREATLDRGQKIPPANRAVLAFVLAYCAYQIVVVLPVSVIAHDLEAIAVFRQLENRLSLLLIPFVYLVGLKVVPPRTLIAWVKVAAVCMAAFATYKYATVGPEGSAAGVSTFRVRELWGGAIPLFGFLLLTSLFLQRPNLWSYVLAMVGLLGMGLTNTRSGFVALFATTLALLITSRRAARRAIIIALVVVTGAALVSAVSPVTRAGVIYSLKTIANPVADRDALDRVDRSRLGWDFFVAHPLGDYQWNQSYYLVYVGPDNFEPHNFVIQLLGQQGIVGFALFIGIIMTTARIGWRNRRADRMSAVMLAYLAFYLIYCLFNTVLLSLSSVLFLILPVALILSRNAALQEETQGVTASLSLPAGMVQNAIGD